jgi:predicted phosphodiesterase
VRIGVLTDLHLAGPRQPPRGWHNPYDHDGVRARLGVALVAFRAAGVDAIAVLGDLTENGDEGSLREALSSIAVAAPGPVWVVPGNHDAVPGAAPLAPAVTEVGPPVGVGWRAAPPLYGVDVVPAARRGSFRAAGFAPPDGTDPLVLLTHFPLIPRRAAMEAAGWKHPGDLADAADLLAELRGLGRPVVVLSGHVHLRDAVVEGPVLSLLHASLIEPPHEYALVDVGEERVTFSAHTAGPAPEGVRIPALAPAEGAWAFRGGSWTAVD